MKRRTFNLTEHTGSKGRAFLAEPGDWFIEEQLDGVTIQRMGRFTYQAATQWASTIENAVKNFIEDNTSECRSCGAKWIMVEGHDAQCPDCGA